LATIVGGLPQCLLAAAMLTTAWLSSGGVSVWGQTSEKTPPAADHASSPSVPANDLHALIEQLGHKDYYVRQRAQEELARLGFDAFDALGAATTHDDLEIAARAKYLLRLIRVEWTVKSDPPEVRRLLRDYEAQTVEGRQARMRALAGLHDDIGVGPLCRLVRFEKSLLLSKLAAVELLQERTSAGPPKSAVVEGVRKLLDVCNRPSAKWLLTWTRMADDPAAALDEWSRLVDAEQASLRRAPSESNSGIVAGLVRFQALQLKRVGKAEEAVAAMHRLVELERGDPGTLAELMTWLVEQKVWKAVDELSQKFAARFSDEPNLLYLLAEAYAEQGQKERAEETATRAFQLYPEKRPDQLSHHYGSAKNLRRQGLFAWAKREYEYVIANAPVTEDVRLLFEFTMMLHDQGEELEAAKVLENAVQALAKKTDQNAEIAAEVSKALQSRIHFHLACHWEQQNDPVKHREHLDKALPDGESDVDILIACYRLPNQSPEYHAKILDLIKKTALQCRDRIAEEPEDDEIYNELAWLIGNTEGDLDEALRLSEKSLEIRPEAGSHYDTLARVCFAKGDLENAVKHQTHALELDPHSGLIAGQLKLFRKTLEEKGKKP